MLPDVMSIGGTIRLYSMKALGVALNAPPRSITYLLKGVECPTLKFEGKVFVDLLTLEKCIRVKLGLGFSKEWFDRDVAAVYKREVYDIRRRLRNLLYQKKLPKGMRKVREGRTAMKTRRANGAGESLGRGWPLAPNCDVDSESEQCE